VHRVLISVAFESKQFGKTSGWRLPRGERNKDPRRAFGCEILPAAISSLPNHGKVSQRLLQISLLRT
jgi:hypothetical protein